MGHRSSKSSSAGSTDGNTTTNNKNQAVKTSKHSKRRSTQSKSAKITDKVPLRTENSFVPIVQFEDGTVAESAQLNDSNNDPLAANNQSGQIIIKIQFRRRLSRMENRQSRRSQQLQQTQTAGNTITDSAYSHLTDANSNQLPSVLNVTLNQNFMPGDSLNLAQRASTEATQAGATGTCRNSLVNNNVEAVSECINELHIRETSLDACGAIDTAEYCEVLEEPSTSISNKLRNKKMNIRAIGDDYSRRPKSKSSFMNLKNILEASTSKSSRNKEVQQSHIQLQSNMNNNCDHSREHIRTHQVSVLSVPVTLAHGETATSTTSSNTTVLTSPTPIAITTSATASSATLPTNVSANGVVPNQVSIWGTQGRTDVIIPLNSQLVVVYPHQSVLTLGRVDDDGIRLTTELVGSGADGGNTNLTTVQSQSQSILVKNAPNGPIVHSQVDFVHCLVPDLERITNSSFYWGKMDRYEAERLLEGKTEGTFLLRDSAQEEYLFSVTFRKYGRSLHARIEQSGHKFSFDCHDPCVFTAPTVTGLLEHYKDPACVMFFEPMLTIPFHRKTAFSLQELARASIVSHTTYDGINKLELPVRLKAYLKEYHYKQKLRVKPLDDAFFTCT